MPSASKSKAKDRAAAAFMNRTKENKASTGCLGHRIVVSQEVVQVAGYEGRHDIMDEGHGSGRDRV